MRRGTAASRGAGRCPRADSTSAAAPTRTSRGGGPDNTDVYHHNLYITNLFYTSNQNLCSQAQPKNAIRKMVRIVY